MANPMFDVCVSGTGLVGKALALALSRDGWRVAWLSGSDGSASSAALKQDVRAYALNAHSVSLLKRLRAWDGIAPHATPIYDMRIEGDGGGVLAFSAWQQCVSELGFIADAAVMEQVLSDALSYAPHVKCVSQMPEGVALHAICEGKQSPVRDALQAKHVLSFDRRFYDHWGVAARLTHDVPHSGVARQWFFSAPDSPDVVALLPFDAPQAGKSYGLVWSTAPSHAQALLAMPAGEFEQALRDRLAGRSGGGKPNWQTLNLASEVSAWPLSLACAKPWCGPGWVLLGDAAHLVHPLAGQGLNLGLGDVDALVHVLRDARDNATVQDIGDERVLQRYERARWLDTKAMLSLTDTLVHLFASDQHMLKSSRNIGMGLVNGLSPIKRWLVNQALGERSLASVVDRSLH